MNARFLRISLHAFMGALAALFLTGALAADVSEHKAVDGVDVYIGVLPSEMILGYPESRTEAEMHGGVPGGENYYHIVVALFDSASGKRITGAQVDARVSELGLAGTEKKLEPMPIAGTITYGNYFKMPPAGIYRIQLHVRRPGVSRAIEVEFQYRHGRT